VYIRFIGRHLNLSLRDIYDSIDSIDDISRESNDLENIRATIDIYFASHFMVYNRFSGRRLRFITSGIEEMSSESSDLKNMKV